MNRLLPLSAVVLVVLAVLGAAAWSQYRVFVGAPLTLGDEVVLNVRRGASVRGVVADLEQRGMTRLDWRWRLLMRLEPVTIRAGEYRLQPGLDPAGFLELLASGDVVRHRFTIIEGWTFAQLLGALGANPVLRHEIGRFDSNAALLEALGVPGSHPEGWFLPETYQFVRGDSDLDLLRRSHAAMTRALAESWARRADKAPLKTPYELLILASIIEKESPVQNERAVIAGVFARRLEKGWRLEADPTVIYGLGQSYDGDIRSRDLRTDTPYNTYTRFGLPPTPIALPARSALDAAANPAPGTAMFFVANGRGGHEFSDTLEEHNRAVRRMLNRNP